MTRYYLLFLLLLLTAAPARAQTPPGASFEVSCDNVRQLRIVRIDPEHWNLSGHTGPFYTLDILLTKTGATVLARVLATAPKRTIVRSIVPWFPEPLSEMRYEKEAVVVTAHGLALPNDDPLFTHFGHDGIGIPIISQQGAFDAARAVLPGPLVPEKVLEEGDAWE